VIALARERRLVPEQGVGLAAPTGWGWPEPPPGQSREERVEDDRIGRPEPIHEIARLVRPAFDGGRFRRDADGDRVLATGLEVRARRHSGLVEITGSPTSLGEGGPPRNVKL
jgi:hypothetical protein